MKFIPLSATGKKNAGKYFAKVDDEDYEWLSQSNWAVCDIKTNSTIYAHRRTDNGTESMHRVIMGAKKGEEIDHINHDGLCNLRNNLRLCTHSQNVKNKRKRLKNKTSKYIGVSLVKRAKNDKWISQIQVDGKKMYIGIYETEEESAMAYDEIAKRYFGEFSNLNFPELKTA